MNRLRLHSLLLLGALLASACFDRGALASAGAAETTSATVIERELGERSYRLVLPPGSSRQPRPLIVALHGGWGSGKNMQDISGLDGPALAAGFVIAYPDGVMKAWNAGSCCATPMKRNIDDVGFLKAVVDDVAKTYGIDRQRVYGTGFSNGAMMLYRVVCEAPGLFKAIAPVSGGPMFEGCKSPQPISAYLIQGRADPRIPFDGGEFEGNYRPGVLSIVGQLGQRAGCGKEQKQTWQDGDTSCATVQGCPGGVELSWCGLGGVGHQWAGGRTLLPGLLGQNTSRFNASRQIVLFFQRH